MIDKKEILRLLDKYNFDPNEYIVISGAAMVLYGIKETTHDLDISVTDKYYKYLEDNYNCELEKKDEYGNNVYYIDKKINFGKLYYSDNKVYLGKIPIQKVEDIVALKKMLGRDKDKKDLRLIDSYLKKRSTNEKD